MTLARMENVNWVAERFGAGDPDVTNWVGPIASTDEEGNLMALAACGKHYGHYPPAMIQGGDCPCPRGCASPAFAA